MTYELIMFYRNIAIQINDAHEADQELLRNLYNAADESVRKEDETIRKVMEELNLLDAIF